MIDSIAVGGRVSPMSMGCTYDYDLSSRGRTTTTGLETCMEY